MTNAQKKKRVYHVTAAYGCDREIACETISEAIAHIEAEMDGSDGDASIGDSLTITVGEMTQKELDDRQEFDGC